MACYNLRFLKKIWFEVFVRTNSKVKVCFFTVLGLAIFSVNIPEILVYQINGNDYYFLAIIINGNIR